MLNTETIIITPEILKSVAELDEFKGAWRAIGRIAPERLSALRQVATIESIGSSTRIEGAQLSDREVEALLTSARVGPLPTRDEQEVAGYAEVMATVYAAYEDVAPTENHIRQFHRDLLVHSAKDERHRGAYKVLANHVEAFDEDGKSLGIVFATATAFETPRRMAELVAWVSEREKDKAFHPLLVVAVFVAVFLQIHPFQDGNGRLSRILTTLLLLRAGYGYVAYSSLESIIERRKELYYLSLRRTQMTLNTHAPDWNPWLEFFLQALQEQKGRLERKMAREQVMLTAIPELSAFILDLAREHGRVTVAQVTKASGASRNTVKEHLRALVRRGLLALHGAGRGAWYGLV